MIVPLLAWLRYSLRSSDYAYEPENIFDKKINDLFNFVLLFALLFLILAQRLIINMKSSQFANGKLPYNTTVNNEHILLPNETTSMHPQSLMLNQCALMNCFMNTCDNQHCKASPATNYSSSLNHYVKEISKRNSELTQVQLNSFTSLYARKKDMGIMYTSAEDNKDKNSSPETLNLVKREKPFKKHKNRFDPTGKLHSLCLNVFLNKPVDISMLDLKYIELQVLVEIMIRKNHTLAKRRLGSDVSVEEIHNWVTEF